MSENGELSKPNAYLAGPTATVAIVDIETTGLEAHDEPITIGILLIKITLPKGDLIRELDSYYGRRQPGREIHPKASAIHGIPLSELEGQSFDEARIRTLLDSADFVIAHYAAFVRQALATVVPGSVTYPWRCSARQIWWKNDFDFNNEKLDTLCAKFGVTRPAVRHTLDECHALSLVLFQRTGQTTRSPTFMGLLISKPPLDRLASPSGSTPLTTPSGTSVVEADPPSPRVQRSAPAAQAASPLSRLWSSVSSIFK
jgi:DNA polymerase-3 subunit epsilon